MRQKSLHQKLSHDKKNNYSNEISMHFRSVLCWMSVILDYTVGLTQTPLKVYVICLLSFWQSVQLPNNLACPSCILYQEKHEDILDILHVETYRHENWGFQGVSVLLLILLICSGDWFSQFIWKSCLDGIYSYTLNNLLTSLHTHGKSALHCFTASWVLITLNWLKTCINSHHYPLL